MKTTETTVEELAIQTIRTLSIDGVEKAKSGHPGMPMGAAPMAFSLYGKQMKHNPLNPSWFNRDRFVLSAGHGSMLLYSILHLTGYGVTMDDLKHFRQWGSATPGHPEYRHTPGVEATTGPLGQGVAMAVGMAMAERHLAAVFNRENHEVIDHYTYAICGDGDLMEGVAAEAVSAAGHLKLGRLIVLYDSNDISLDGELHMSFSEDVAERFKAYGWHYLHVEDGNDLAAINKAVELAKVDDRPTLIEVKTTIGYGSPNKGGKSASHGAPLGAEEVKETKAAYGWNYEDEFFVPEEVAVYFDKVKERGRQYEERWNRLMDSYRQHYPELWEQLTAAVRGDLPTDWDAEAPSYEAGKDNVATRSSGGESLNAFAKRVPAIFGGSADLASSNKTMLKGTGNFTRDDYSGRNVWFGVREFAMGAMVNGMALHGGVKPFGATFFVFSDYLRPALRLSALMKLPAIFVFTHDSIAVGEDGPTHEPVEQLASLRAVPGFNVIRPADSNEVVAAWKTALESKDEPVALVLSRQELMTVVPTVEEAYKGVKKGAYTISAANGPVQGLLLASGSEVSLAVEAQRILEGERIYVAVVSMPSWSNFEKQPQAYRELVIPPNVKVRLGIEMGSSFGWHKYVGDEGEVLAIDRFGASAPSDKILLEYGFTVENIVSKVKKMI
ncbi:transketolase [Evansella caseinilytica]|uniref:Transketolase n=1 Tax=Evansella caseinilytica TaxID=1503961 RepID=A0A1H3IKF2_9BACI|nr:transketolase [Evansella caseinilytica]SDY28170.1 transketolase [Evansella caseinilytica]